MFFTTQQLVTAFEDCYLTIFTKNLKFTSLIVIMDTSNLGHIQKGNIGFICMGMGDKTNMDNFQMEIRRFICGKKIVLVM